MDLLAQRAVEEALRGNWKQAIALNEEILDSEPKNKEALNRLARSFYETDKITKASTVYRKVLKLDPYNSIAKKALERIKSLKEFPKKINGLNNQSKTKILFPGLFIEEPGKTKSVTLIHLGAPQIVTSLDAGQVVLLEPHAHRVSVLTNENEFVGRLPDDIGHRIIKLTQAGNKYTAYIRSTSPDCVIIFIKELERSLEFKDTPSFPPQEKASFVSFNSPHKEQDEEDIATGEDIEEEV